MDNHQEIKASPGLQKATGASPGLKIVLMTLSLILIFLGLWETDFFERFKTPEQKLEKVWSRDFEKLKKTQILSAGFSNIKKVEYIATSKRLKDFLLHYKKPDFSEKAQGQNLLEIFMDVLDDGGVVIQYDLIDAKGNTVWELGRTFNFKGKSFTN